MAFSKKLCHAFLSIVELKDMKTFPVIKIFGKIAVLDD